MKERDRTCFPFALVHKSVSGTLCYRMPHGAAPNLQRGLRKSHARIEGTKEVWPWIFFEEFSWWLCCFSFQ